MSSRRSYANSSDAGISIPLTYDTRETSWLSIDNSEEDLEEIRQREREKAEDETLWDIIREALDECEQIEDDDRSRYSGDNTGVGEVEMKGRISRVGGDECLDDSKLMECRGGEEEERKGEDNNVQDEKSSIKEEEVKKDNIEKKEVDKKEIQKEELDVLPEIAIAQKEIRDTVIDKRNIEKTEREEKKKEIEKQIFAVEKQDLDEHKVQKSEAKEKNETKENEVKENNNLAKTNETSEKMEVEKFEAKKEVCNDKEEAKKSITQQELFSTAYWDIEAAFRVDLADNYAHGEALGRWLEEPPPVPPKDDIEDIDIYYSPPPTPPKDYYYHKHASALNNERHFSSASSFYSVYAQLPSIYIPTPIPIVPPIPQEYRPSIQARLPITRRSPTPQTTREDLLPPLPPKPTVKSIATQPPPPPPLSNTSPFYIPPQRKPLSKPLSFTPPRSDSLQNPPSYNKYLSSSIYDDIPSQPPTPPKTTIADPEEKKHSRRWGMAGIECLLPTNFADSLVGLDMPDISRVFSEEFPAFGSWETAMKYTITKLTGIH